PGCSCTWSQDESGLDASHPTTVVRAAAAIVHGQSTRPERRGAPATALCMRTLRSISRRWICCSRLSLFLRGDLILCSTEPLHAHRCTKTQKEQHPAPA
nr:hypothetical protein [Tanacetum cinerariifolium]